MYSKSQFYSLEVMCRERAAAAAKERDFWLAEAEEWAQVRLDCNYGSEPLTSSPELMPSASCKTSWASSGYAARSTDSARSGTG
jgi:hypothetical protein